MTNHRNVNTNENVVMADCTAAKAQIIGDIVGTVCDKDGKALNKVKVTEVTYSKNSKFNLFSLSTMMKKGWKLNGD